MVNLRVGKFNVCIPETLRKLNEGWSRKKCMVREMA